MPRVSGYYRKTDNSAVTTVHVLKFKRRSDGVEFTVNTTSNGTYSVILNPGTYDICKTCPGETVCEPVNSPAPLTVGTMNIIVIIKGPCNPSC